LNILKSICGHQDLTALNDAQRIALCQQIREFLVSSISKTGGHLASNLGVVELTVAIETVFNTQKDRLVFDVGHQSYVHKLLTGRQADFASLRQFGGIAGFPKPSESDTDAFVAGHASSSVSVALGMARARTLMKQDYDVIALLGDGAATGGMVYEGLNDAAVSGEPIVIILNDNAMSIDRNVGGMAVHLSRLRTKERYLGMKQQYRSLLERLPCGQAIYRITRKMKDGLRRALIPETIFESMGLTYLGPVDGHDVSGLITLLRNARDMRCPVVVHVLTKKGKGYPPAEMHPKRFHGIGKFDPNTGESSNSGSQTFSDVFGETLVTLAAENRKICAITAAMPGGTGLLPFKQTFPERLFDVGIAEEHAVSMAGGLAKQGMIPVVAIYSTFLQRAYDMILQDVAMQRLHVVFAVDRAGLVGEDGETHHGVFDVGFLRQIPGVTVLCPVTFNELQVMLKWALEDQDGPVAIRYPRGTGCSGDVDVPTHLSLEDPVRHCGGKDAVCITYGCISKHVLTAAEILRGEGIFVSVLRLRMLSLDSIHRTLQELDPHTHIFVIEETCGGGIAGELALRLSGQNTNRCITGIDLGKQFVPHGTVNVLYKQFGLDAQSIAGRIMDVLKVKCFL